jgi:hypothetical protein
VECFGRPLLKPRVEDGEDPIPFLDEYPLLRYAAAVVAVALCLSYRVDLLANFGLFAAAPWIGYVITGLLAARGSNFIHEFAARWPVS